MLTFQGLISRCLRTWTDHSAAYCLFGFPSRLERAGDRIYEVLQSFEVLWDGAEEHKEGTVVGKEDNSEQRSVTTGNEPRLLHLR